MSSWFFQNKREAGRARADAAIIRAKYSKQATSTDPVVLVRGATDLEGTIEKEPPFRREITQFLEVLFGMRRLSTVFLPRAPSHRLSHVLSPFADD